MTNNVLTRELTLLRIRFEEHPDNFFCITFDLGVYHWFKIESDGMLIFDHSYSTRTGSTKSSYSQGQKVKASLNRKGVKMSHFL